MAPGSQVTLMLLVQGPHVENHGSKIINPLPGPSLSLEVQTTRLWTPFVGASLDFRGTEGSRSPSVGKHFQISKTVWIKCVFSLA